MRLLDIGGGSCVFSLYAAASGASRVLCLEPEGAGSLKGKRETFQQVAAESGVQSVETLPDLSWVCADIGDDRMVVVANHSVQVRRVSVIAQDRPGQTRVIKPEDVELLRFVRDMLSAPFEHGHRTHVYTR